VICYFFFGIVTCIFIAQMVSNLFIRWAPRNLFASKDGSLKVRRCSSSRRRKKVSLFISYFCVAARTTKWFASRGVAGCQICREIIYQNGRKYTAKLPNGHKYTKCPQYIPYGHKICQHFPF
jgi:hypothetical protein